ncbi:hypothetical protein HK104_005755 [Borealophlyctis nickersoniae]|nr:hypothetical protein HK104_005755 [Borealophlyctis nickersoniae]
MSPTTTRWTPTTTRPQTALTSGDAPGDGRVGTPNKSKSVDRLEEGNASKEAWGENREVVKTGDQKGRRKLRRARVPGADKPMTVEESQSKWASQSLRVRERTYDVNLVTAHMPIYEPLLDEYLQDYFNSPNMRRHLTHLGLIDKEGTITEPRAFKTSQVRLDKEQYLNSVVKKQEDMELDRDIEVSEEVLDTWSRKRGRGE